MKIYIIYCVPVQIFYFWKMLLRYRPKCSQPFRLQDFQIKRFSRADRWNNLIFCMLIHIYKNQKLIEKFLVGHGQKWVWPSGLCTLKLTVSQERTDGTKCVFACWYSFTQIKRWLNIFEASMVKKMGVASLVIGL